jgi:hypothetical protein
MTWMILHSLRAKFVLKLTSNAVRFPKLLLIGLPDYCNVFIVTSADLSHPVMETIDILFYSFVAILDTSPPIS